MRVFIPIFLLVFLGQTAIANPGIGKEYAKTYYENGQLQAEGWLSMDTKNGYWKFYHANGQLASKGHFKADKKTGYWYFYNSDGFLEKEGHFLNDKSENWWIFYEIGTQNSQRLQFKKGKKDGVCLIYKKKKLVKAQRYSANKKLGEWTSVFAFKRDNPDIRLR